MLLKKKFWEHVPSTGHMSLAFHNLMYVSSSLYLSQFSLLGLISQNFYNRAHDLFLRSTLGPYAGVYFLLPLLNSITSARLRRNCFT